MDLEAITFDCYGTLVDWESGILSALRPVLAKRGAGWSDDAILGSFARHEAALEAGPFRGYREILSAVVDGITAEAGFVAEEREREALASSLPQWPLFPDTRDALTRLGTRYRLGVLSNVDDDLFAATQRTLGQPLEWAVTAQQVGAYKPSPRSFRRLVQHVGLPEGAILHAAQSLYHDIAPAREAGLRTVWVDRRGGRAGTGATPPSDVIPDARVPDLASLADGLLAR